MMLLVAGRRARLVDHVLHVPGRQELALLDVHRLAAGGDGVDEIGLAAQERRGLQHVDHGRDFDLSGVSSCTSVSTGTPICLLDLGRGCAARPPCPDRGKLCRETAVGLVEGGLEMNGMPRRRGQISFSCAGGIERKLLAFDRRRGRRSGKTAGPARLRSRRVS